MTTSPSHVFHESITDRVTTRSHDYQVLRKTLPSRYDLPRHRHRNATLTLVLEGEYREEFHDDHHRCGAMSVQFKPAGTAHTTRAGVEGVRMFILDIAPGDPETSPIGPDRPLLLEPGVPTALALLARDAQREGDRSSREAMGHHLSRLLESVRARRRPDESTTPDWIIDAGHRIRELDPSATRAGVLAAQLRVHPVYLARVFRRHLGCPVGTYVRRCRVDRAVSELLRDDRPLATMAHELGYFDQSHFTHDFRRETGTTPHAFRASVRAGRFD